MDDAGAGGEFDDVKTFLKLLHVWGPPRGYFPEPTRSILVVKSESVERSTALFHPLGFQVKTGARYLGGYIGYHNKQTSYFQQEVKEWTLGVCRLSVIARSFP